MNNNETGAKFKPFYGHSWIFFPTISFPVKILIVTYCFALKRQTTSKCFENFPCPSFGVKRIKLKTFRFKMMENFVEILKRTGNCNNSNCFLRLVVKWYLNNKSLLLVRLIVNQLITQFYLQISFSSGRTITRTILFSKKL